MTFKRPFSEYAHNGLEAILEHSSLGIAFTRNQQFIRCNRVFETMFGLGQGELLGQPTSCIFESEANYKSFSELARQRLSDDASFDINWRFTRSGSDELMCHIRAQSLSGDGGDEVTVWIVEDLQAALQQAAALERSITQLNAVFENAPVGIIFTAKRKIVKANPEFCKTFLYDPNTAINLSGRELFPSDAAYEELGRMAYPLLSQGKSLVYETEMVRSNGEVFWAQLIAYVLNPKMTDEGTIWMITDRSEVKRHAEATHHAMLENQIILDSAVVGIVYLKNRVVERCNPKAEEIFGTAPGALVGTSTRAWYPSEADFRRVADEVYQAMMASRVHTHEQTMLRADGTPFWGRLAGQILDPEQPVEGASIWVVEDLTERHAAEQDLVQAKALMQAVFDSAKVSIIVTDAVGVVRMMNRTAGSWLGYEPAELIGQVTPRVFHDPDEVVAYSRELSAEFGEEVAPGFDTFVIKARLYGSDTREWSYIRHDGSRFPVHLTTSVLRDASGDITGYIGVAIDVTDRSRADNAMRIAQMHLEERVIIRTAELAAANQKLHEEMSQRRVIEEKMRQMAHYDGLTGLPNRNLLFGRLEKALAVAKRKRTNIALMFIDLDRFKWVNDTLGHDAGDALLRQVATRMSSVIRETDTLSRHGGDEFVLLMPDVAFPGELAILAERLLGEFVLPFEIGGQEIHTTPSIGIACYPDHCADVESLLRYADAAMYQAKMAGKNCFRLFATAGSPQASGRRTADANAAAQEPGDLRALI